jgi:hypothetical protein
LQTYSDLVLQGFAARALLAILDGKAPEAERSTLRDSKQFPYHEEAHPDLLMIETRFGHNFNMSQRFVLYGEKRTKALWRMSVDTWWNEQALLKLGVSPTDALFFFDEARKQAFRLGRVTNFKFRETRLAEQPVVNLHFNDGCMEPDFQRFIGETSVKVRIYGANGKADQFKEHELCEAYYQGGRL